ncbi:MAG: AroM family protein [Bacteroides sp.]
MNTIGIIFLGKAPRKDMYNEVRHYIKDCEIRQYGALDEVDDRQIGQLEPENNGHMLTTELPDGRFIKLDKKKILPYMQDAVTRAESDGNKLNIICCTSIFPEFQHSGILLMPGKVLLSMKQYIGNETKIAALVPTERHCAQVRKKWEAEGIAVDTLVLSPYNYTIDEMYSLRAQMEQYECLILECAGYTYEFVEQLKECYQGLVMSPMELTVRIAAGLIL